MYINLSLENDTIVPWLFRQCLVELLTIIFQKSFHLSCLNRRPRISGNINFLSFSSCFFLCISLFYFASFPSPFCILSPLPFHFSSFPFPFLIYFSSLLHPFFLLQITFPLCCECLFSWLYTILFCRHLLS